MSHRLLACLSAAALVGGGFAASASADVRGTLFEPPDFSPGSTFNGQGGWFFGDQVFGSQGLDHAIVNNTAAPDALRDAFGTQSLRISNAVATTSFDHQTVSAPVIDGAGERSAATFGLAGGIRRPRMAISFWFAAADFTGARQPNLNVEVDPINGSNAGTRAGGMARMGYVGITDGATGLDVNWQDTPDVAGADGHVAFAVHPVASGLSRTAAHHVLILLAFNEGPDNDVARISVDGAKAITATTWENYYRTDTEAAGSNHRVPVSDSLMFGSRRNPDPALQGKGLLFDDVRISTPRISPTAPAPSTPTPVPPADNAGFTTIAPVTVNNNTNNNTSVPVEATSESAGIRVRKATLDRKDGELKLELYCPVESGLCSGSLSLRGNQRNLAAKGFNQIGGAKFPLTLHLSGDARKQLRSSAKVQALMTSRDSEGIATRLTRTFTR